jgi:hypothetical protein
VGEVASSNLVVPTIYSIIFNKLEAQLWVHLAKMTLYVGLLLDPFSRNLLICFRLPFWPHRTLLIDYRTIAR